MLKRRIFHLITTGLVILAALMAGIWGMTTNASVPADTRFSIIDGRKISLAELGGRPVIVNFWATTCHICRQELPGLIKLYTKYNDQGLEIINVAMPYDPPNRVLDMANKINIPFPVAIDVNGEAVRAFGGVNATPTLFLVTPDGNIDMKNTGKTNMNKLEKRIKELLSPKITGYWLQAASYFL